MIEFLSEQSIQHCFFGCEKCNLQLLVPQQLDSHHWRCLHVTAWSIVPAIQVVAVQVLSQLKTEEWASLLLEQVYLPPEVRKWLGTNY